MGICVAFNFCCPIFCYGQRFRVLLFTKRTIAGTAKYDRLHYYISENGQNSYNLSDFDMTTEFLQFRSIGI